MTFSFSGPSTDIFLAAAGGVLAGGLYSVVAKTHPVLSVAIFVIRELADWILYRLVTLYYCASQDRSCAQIYAVTNLTVNVATLCVLRHLDLIGAIGTRVFVGLMAIEMICKCADFSRYRVCVVD